MPDPTNVPSSAGLLLLLLSLLGAAWLEPAAAAAGEPRLTDRPGSVTARFTADPGSCQWACRTSTRPFRLSVVAKAVLGGDRDWLCSWPSAGIATSLQTTKEQDGGLSVQTGRGVPSHAVHMGW